MGGDSQRTLFDNGPPARPSALPARYARPGKRPAKTRRNASGKSLPKAKSNTGEAVGPETRMESYQRIVPVLADLQKRVLRFLLESGASTDQEIQMGLRLRLDTTRARRCELRDLGVIIDSGKRRPTDSGRSAVVWMVNPSFSSGRSSPAASMGDEADKRGDVRDGTADLPTAPPTSPATVPAGRPAGIMPRETRQPTPKRRCGLGRGPLGGTPGRDPCYSCGQLNWWRSIHGAIVCGHCHPPATPELVAEWIDASNDRRGVCRD